MLEAALALWRGPAYADVADRPFAVREIARLDSMRRSAVRGHAQALLALGRHLEAIDQLVGAVADEPYDEALRKFLALALYAEQRVEEAAQVCRDGLTLLRDRGIEAPDLQQVQRAILRREAPAAARPARPCLLPPDPARFVARAEEFERARRHLCDPALAGEPLVVTGPAGVGKTTLAVRLAHAVAERFPDGQLYVNLRGFDLVGSALSPAEAVRGFLDALDVPTQRMPVTVEAQSGLYRSLLADRRILVVLDNARDAVQVRPLLPGAPGCAVVVTSRNQLTGLATADGADPLTLELLSAAEALAAPAATSGRGPPRGGAGGGRRGGGGVFRAAAGPGRRGGTRPDEPDVLAAGPRCAGAHRAGRARRLRSRRRRH